MNNVIRLFARDSSESALSEPESSFSAAVASVLALSAQLCHMGKEVSKQFDAIENAVDTLDDAGTRNRIKQSIKVSRETLSKAMKVSQQVEEIANCRGG